MHSFWISCFGVPSTVTTDRGRQFESALWNQLVQLLGCKCIRTTSYHPAANGLIECFHRQLKTSLKSHPDPTHWTDSLPVVLLGVRTQLKDDLQRNWHMDPLCALLGIDASKAEAIPDPACYVTRLKTMMRTLQAAPVRKQYSRKSNFKVLHYVMMLCENPCRNPMMDHTKYRNAPKSITQLTSMR